jgi:hypothetical protein
VIGAEYPLSREYMVFEEPHHFMKGGCAHGTASTTWYDADWRRGATIEDGKADADTC